MQVWELMEKLKMVEPDKEVFVSKDGYGSLFNPLDGVSEAYMDGENEPTDSLTGTPAVILWP